MVIKLNKENSIIGVINYINSMDGYRYIDHDNLKPEETFDGIIPLLKIEDKQIVRRSQKEIAADRAKLPAPSPTPSQQLAQLQADGISRDLALAELAAEIENIRGGTK